MAQAMEFFGPPEDGPFVMVNPLKFKPRAEYADGSDGHLTGREAYARYGVEVAKVETLGAGMQVIEHHRNAGLAGQLNIKTKAGF